MKDNFIVENNNTPISNDNSINFCRVDDGSSPADEEIYNQFEISEHKENTNIDTDFTSKTEHAQEEQDVATENNDIEVYKYENDNNDQLSDMDSHKINGDTDQEMANSKDVLKEDNNESNLDSNSEILLNSVPNQVNIEEHSGSINIPESSLPYKLWIDAKSRDWILEWQTKNGRWSVRKFSCKRWGKGKAYSHAMNFLASLTSCGIIKDSNYNRQINDIVNPNSDSSNKSNRSVEDELVLQFLSQRDAAATADKQKSGFGSNSGLNTLAAIAAAATAAAIASTPTKSQPTKEQPSLQNNTHTQHHTRGAVRKSGVPGVYWSQKPQGWRVVYYTGKDREFEYFKVPANASEEIISEILEVAKRFRSQVTAEGRHLPNGAIGSGSKRARMAERKAAAAASASASEASRHILQNRTPHYPNDNISDYIKTSASDTVSKGLLDSDPLSQFTTKFNGSNLSNIQTHTGPIIPGPFDWIYNPLLLNLYGNYSAATQAAAMQQWAILQNSISQNGSLISTSVSNQAESSANSANSILNSLVPNPFINPFQIQLPSIVGQNSNIMTQIPSIPAVNPASQMGVNMLSRYYGMTLPTQPSQISGISVNQQPSVPNSNSNSNSNNSNSSNITNPIGITPSSEAISWINQLASMQQLYSNLDPSIQPCNFDPFKNIATGQAHVGPARNEEENSIISDTNKQSDNLLEMTSGSNKTSN